MGLDQMVSPGIWRQGQKLIIAGEEIPVEYKELPLENVQLDPSNPRIQHAVLRKSENGKLSDLDLRTLILDQPGVSELFRSIRDNGGILEPIYVRPDGRVIEGNCRAASYLKLNQAHPSDSRWKSIPAIFVPKISDKQVAILQGNYHVAGKNKWQAYEKVGHLHRMHTILKMDAKSIAEALGLRENDVIRDLKAYETMTNKLLPKMKGGNVLKKWSFVQELYKRKELAEYRNRPENVDEFVSMVTEGKLKKGVDVRNLEKVLKSPAAVKTLKKQNMEAAMTVVGKSDPTADSKTFRKLRQAATLLEHMPNIEVQRLQESHQSRQILLDLYQALKTVSKTAGIKLT